MRKEAPSVMGDDHAIFFRIRDILESARTRVARTVNSTQVIANWLIGREIVEHEQCGSHRADYGKQLVAQLSKKITASFGRGWSVQNLFYMKQFYQCYPRLLDQGDILHALRGESSQAQILHAASGIFDTLPMTSNAWKPGELHAGLSWTHYRTLLREKRSEARSFYEVEAANNAWTAREMERQMNSCLYDRLTKSRNQKELLKLANEGFHPMRPIDVMKDPVVLEFLDLPESPKLVESGLEQALIDNLQTFLLELGKGFAFVSRQERITLDGDHFYIDLVFYHTILKCFVLIDLKAGKLSHGDLGQIQFYVNYYDQERCSEGDNPTIGIVLCRDKNDAVVKYTLGEQQKKNIFTSRYQLYLPTEEELQQEIQRELRYLEMRDTVPETVEPEIVEDKS